MEILKLSQPTCDSRIPCFDSNSVSFSDDIFSTALPLCSCFSKSVARCSLSANSAAFAPRSCSNSNIWWKKVNPDDNNTKISDHDETSPTSRVTLLEGECFSLFKTDKMLVAEGVRRWFKLTEDNWIVLCEIFSTEDVSSCYQITQTDTVFRSGNIC